jgi:hypothetical protein
MGPRIRILSLSDMVYQKETLSLASARGTRYPHHLRGALAFMATTAPTTIQAPKVHPALIGATYGLVAAIINYGTILINKKVIGGNGNGLIGFAGTVLLPLVALYLAGHYAGRHERLNHLQTSVTEGIRSVIAGTGAGTVTGIVYVVLTALSAKLNPVFGLDTGSQFGVIGAIGGFFAVVGGFIVWLFLGIFGGTIGGVFGDSRAHKQLRQGAVVAK